MVSLARVTTRSRINVNASPVPRINWALGLHATLKMQGQLFLAILAFKVEDLYGYLNDARSAVLSHEIFDHFCFQRGQFVWLP